MVEGYELNRQVELAPLRHFVTAICQSSGAKVNQRQLLALPLIDGESESATELVEKILTYARKRKKHGSGIEN